MARGLLAHALAAEQLDALFREHATQQYEGKLLFSSVVDLPSLVVSKTQKSLHAAYQTHHKKLAVSLTAFYDKLAGMELSVIRGLVRETAQQMWRVAEQLEPERPSSLADYEVLVLDGSHPAATERRIKETRDQRGAPLPGHALVVLNSTRRPVVDML